MAETDPDALFPEGSAGALLLSEPHPWSGLSAKGASLAIRVVDAGLELVQPGEGEEGEEADELTLKPWIILKVREFDTELQVDLEDEFPHSGFAEAFARPAPADARGRAQATLDALVRANDSAGVDELLERLLDTLTPAPAPGSLMAWAERGAQAELQKEGYLAKAEANGAGAQVRLATLSVDRSFRFYGEVRGELEAKASGKGAPAKPLTEEITLGTLSASAAQAPAPSLAKEPFAALVRGWKGYFATGLKRRLEASGAVGFYAADAVPSTPLFGLLELWITQGPPGPEPKRIQVAPAVQERTARALRPLSDRERADFQAFIQPQLSYAFDVEGYQLGLCRGPWGDDTLFLRPPQSDAVMILRSDGDPASRHKFPIDGDAWAMRNLLDWLRNCLIKGGHDELIPAEPPEAEFEFEKLMAEGASDIGLGFSGKNLAVLSMEPLEEAPPEEPEEPFEEEEEPPPEEDANYEPPPDLGPQEIRLSDWLRFADGIHPDEPRFDWRLPGDLIEGRSYAETVGEEEAAWIRSHAVPLYHQFIRKVLDPSFKPKG